MQLLVRNRVKEFAHWKKVFDADLAPAADYGLTLDRLWQTVEDPNMVYFILNVESMERARAFMARPASAEMGEVSGVIDGEAHFIVSPE